MMLVLNKYFILILLLIIICCPVGRAQCIAYINSDTISHAMPQYKHMLRELDSIKIAFDHHGEHLMMQYELMQKGLQRLDCFHHFPDSVIEKEIDELQNLQTSIEFYRDTALAQTEAAKQQKLKAIHNLILTAVKKVAIEQSYDYVLDDAKKAFYYLGDDLVDISGEVLIRFGILPKSESAEVFEQCK